MAQALTQSIYHTEEEYYNLPEDIRAELINGQIYNMAPPSRIHQELLGFLFKKIANYIDLKKGTCKVYPAPFAVKLFEDNKTIVEPDISVICDRSKLTDQGCTGSPDWIIEIVSPSNSSYDYVRKLNLYMNARVREYWIVNPMEEAVLVYFLDSEKNKFQVNSYAFQDKIQVNIYEDLWIDFKELNL